MIYGEGLKMVYNFSILIAAICVVRTAYCQVNNIEDSRRVNQNRFPVTESDDALNDVNARKENPAPNFDVETFRNQLSSFSPTEMQQLANLLAQRGAFNSLQDRNNNETSRTNFRNNDRRLSRRRAGRNGRRRCRRGGNRKYGNGAGFGSDMGYGSGNGTGVGADRSPGSGFGAGQGYGAGAGAGDGYGLGTGVGAGRGLGAGNRFKDYGARPSVGSGYRNRGGNESGTGEGYGSTTEPYDNTPSSSPNVRGTQGATIGGGSETIGVKVNSLTEPANNRVPPRMTSGQDRRFLNSLLPAQRENQELWSF